MFTNVNDFATLTDQLERELIQQEIDRQFFGAPMFNLNLKRIADRIAAMFGYVRIDGTLNTRVAH